jgi:hypothetical protein
MTHCFHDVVFHAPYAMEENCKLACACCMRLPLFTLHPPVASTPYTRSRELLLLSSRVTRSGNSALSVTIPVKALCHFSHYTSASAHVPRFAAAQLLDLASMHTQRLRLCVDRPITLTHPHPLHSFFLSELFDDSQKT